MIDQILLSVGALGMADKNFTIIVRPFLMGQFRIQITDITKPDSGAPKGHGSIAGQMCTYKHGTMRKVVKELKDAKDVMKKYNSYRQPWNSDHSTDRIRLDNNKPNY